MTDLALTQQDVATFLQRDLTDDETFLLGLLLPAQQDALETWLGRPVTVRHFVETYVISAMDPRIFFRKSPCVRVDSVTADDGVSTFAEGTDFLLQPFGLDFQTWVPSERGAAFVVDYWAGLNGAEPTAASAGDYVPAVRLVLLQAARRVLNGQTTGGLDGVKRLSTDGGYTVEFTDAASVASGFTDADLAMLKRKRRRSIG